MIEPDRRVWLLPRVFPRWSPSRLGWRPWGLCYPASIKSCVANSTGGTTGPRQNRLWGRKLVVAASDFTLYGPALLRGGYCIVRCATWNPAILGMRTAGLLVFGISPQSNIRTDADAVRFHTALLGQYAGLAGVDSATIMEVRIGSGGSDNDGVLVDGRNPALDRPFAGVRINLVGSAFLRTLGIPLRLGRDMQDSDTANSPKVAIVNQTFVDRYLPGQGPSGTPHRCARRPQG